MVCVCLGLSNISILLIKKKSNNWCLICSHIMALAIQSLRFLKNYICRYLTIFTISLVSSVHIYVHKMELFLQTINLQSMFQQKKGCFRIGSPANSSTGSSVASSSVQEERHNLGGKIGEERLVQQGLPEDQIDQNDIQDIRNIKETIVLLQNQILKQDENDSIPRGKAEEIRLKLHKVEAELERLIAKKMENSNIDYARRYSEDLVSQKDSYIAELEKKIQTYEEKLRQAAQREEKLEGEIRRLNSVIGEVSKEVEVPTRPKHKQGLEVIRKCTPEEENLISKQYQKIKHQLEKKSENIVLYNTFRDGKFSNDPSESQELHQWVKRLIEEIEPGAGCYPVVQTFILNPKENQLTQDYHMDFGDHMRTLFINMDYLTSLNSTQFFKEPLQHHTKLSLRGAKQYGNNEKEILNRENREFIEVSQMICKPYNILLCKPGTVHRGIANRSGVDRVVFSVCYTNVEGYFSGEPKIGTQKEDIE